MNRPTHRAPHQCPVCEHDVLITRVSCPSCGSELAGEFLPCQFCQLNDDDMRTLTVFLASRGNLREVAKHLGVSYPTARQRMTALLMQLGLSGSADEPDLDRDAILAGVADGSIDPAEGARLIAAL